MNVLGRERSHCGNRGGRKRLSRDIRITKKVAGSVEISMGRVESTSTGGISGASWRGDVRFGAGGDAARAGLGILVSSVGGGDGCRVIRLVMLGPPGLTESGALRK